MDRDGDGMISADDIFTTHALIMQMSAVFVRVSVIFIYVHILNCTIYMYILCRLYFDSILKRFGILEDN